MSAAEREGDLAPELVDWVRELTGAEEVAIERRTGGASRAGYAVDVRLARGEVRALWLRVDTGVGPQSRTVYTLRREAAVYRAVAGSAVRIARLVGVHPTLEAFLLERIDGRGAFAEVRDPPAQLAIARAFMEQLAELHRLDPRKLELPELGEPRSIGEHVREEIEIWDAQYRAQCSPEPLLALALCWLRRRIPADGDWPLVLVQGDTGPGNFMHRGFELAAITDWELAHWGDLHDDLGWVCVRDVQEPFPALPERLRDYERASGRRIDRERLRWFRVLAQTRCAIGTRTGLLARDSRTEMAAHVIFNTLHMRLLAEALAAASGVAVPASVPLEPEAGEGSWAFDVALEDLRAHVVPALGDGFASRRAKGVARLLKYLAELERLGPSARRAERDDLSRLLGRDVSDLAEGRAALCEAIERARVDEQDALAYGLAQADRATQVARPAMGALAERHHAPID